VTQRLRSSVVSTQYEKGRQKGHHEIVVRLLDSLKKVLPVNTDKELAEWIGVKGASISQWQSGTASPQRNALQRITKCLLSAWVEPLVETEPVHPAKSKKGWRVDGDKQRRSRLCQRLKDHRGVYLFYDSLGQVTYIGQAKKNLFFELEQQLKQKPRHKVYVGAEGATKLQAKQLQQGDIARFLSAYETPTSDAAHNAEALLIRAIYNSHQNRNQAKFRLGEWEA